MKIVLKGIAGERFGAEHSLSVSTPQEALQSLFILVPGFRNFLTVSHEHGIYWKVLTNHWEQGIEYGQLSMQCAEMVLVPIISGAAPGGFFGGPVGKILIGAALVATSLFLAAPAAGTVAAMVKTGLFTLGSSMVLGGIVQAITPGIPQRKSSSSGERKDTDAVVFDRAADTTSQGVPIPVLYGRYLVRSAPVLSSYVSDDNKGYWLGLVSEGPIKGFVGIGPIADNVYVNGARFSGFAGYNAQFVDGNQSSGGDYITLVKSAGFHIPVQQDFVAGNYAPTVRSFTQKYADRIRLRFRYGPVYAQVTRTTGINTNNDVVTKISYLPINGSSDITWTPIGWNVKLLANGVPFRDDNYYEAGPALATKIRNISYDCTGRDMPISLSVQRIDTPIPVGQETSITTGKTSSTQVNLTKGDFQWVSADVEWDERLLYPTSALLALEFNTTDFTSIPQIGILAEGRIVPTIDSSLNVSYEYSNNPAYVLLDMLTNPRFGLGGRSYTLAGTGTVVNQPGIKMNNASLAAFKKAADYCDRNNVRFNAYLDSDADSYEVVQNVASMFQSQAFYAGNSIFLTVDDVVSDEDFKLFSEANVVQEESDGEITTPACRYEGTARAARQTAVQVSYNDERYFFTEKKVLVEDRDAIARYGYRLAEIRAFGATTIQQAERAGRYFLATNLANGETVSFSLSSEGALLLPGDPILIADPLKHGSRLGGRIVSAAASSIVIDGDLPSGLTDYSLWTYGSTGVAQRLPIASIVGRTITTAQPFPLLPTSQQNWLIARGRSDSTFRAYKVQSVKEGADKSYDVVAIRYDEAKYDYVNNGQGSPASAQRAAVRRHDTDNLAVAASDIGFTIKAQ